MRRTDSIVLVLCIFSVIFAGCTGSDDASSSAATGTATPPLDSPRPANGTPERVPEHVSDRSSGSMVWILPEPAENRTVTIRHKAEASQVETCRNLIKPPGDHAWFSYTVWNRTGMVAYSERGVAEDDLDIPFATTFELPDDPPYMFLASFCSFWLWVDFEAYEWTQGLSSRGEFVSAEWAYFNVSIPAGSLSGTGGIDLTYPRYFVELGPLSGRVEPQDGMQYGDWYFYGPSDQGDDWILHGWHHVDDSAWESQRLVQHSEPGRYSVRIDLSAPSPFETRWMVELGLIRFKETIGDLGFTLPLRTYV